MENGFLLPACFEQFDNSAINFWNCVTFLSGKRRAESVFEEQNRLFASDMYTNKIVETFPHHTLSQGNRGCLHEIWKEYGLKLILIIPLPKIGFDCY